MLCIHKSYFNDTTEYRVRFRIFAKESQLPLLLKQRSFSALHVIEAFDGKRAHTPKCYFKKIDITVFIVDHAT